MKKSLLFVGFACAGILMGAVSAVAQVAAPAATKAEVSRTATGQRVAATETTNIGGANVKTGPEVKPTQQTVQPAARTRVAGEGRSVTPVGTEPLKSAQPLDRSQPQSTTLQPAATSK